MSDKWDETGKSESKGIERRERHEDSRHGVCN